MLQAIDAVEGASVVDLFAGSGALGVEALSRGADTCTFVDDDRIAVAAVRANLEALGGDFTARATVVHSDALRFVSNMPVCDVLFADPPYAFDSWADLLARAAPKVHLLVAETGAPFEPGPDWQTVKVKTYGGTVVTVARPEEACRTSRPGDI